MAGTTRRCCPTDTSWTCRTSSTRLQQQQQPTQVRPVDGKGRVCWPGAGISAAVSCLFACGHAGTQITACVGFESSVLHVCWPQLYSRLPCLCPLLLTCHLRTKRQVTAPSLLAWCPSTRHNQLLGPLWWLARAHQQQQTRWCPATTPLSRTALCQALVLGVCTLLTAASLPLALPLAAARAACCQWAPATQLLPRPTEAGAVP